MKQSIHPKYELTKVKYSISQDDFPARPNDWCYNCMYQIQCEFRDINLWEVIYNAKQKNRVSILS